MTDSTGANAAWQPPAGPPPGSAQPDPGAGPYAPPYAAPGASTPPPGAPGWTPPPKPGLIPLRPLTLGTLLGASFQVLRRNPRPIFGSALLLTGAVFLLSLLVTGLITVFALGRALMATGQDADTIAAGSIATVALSALVTAVLSITVTAILQGIVVLEVARGTLGEKLTLRGLWRGMKSRVGALLGWALLLTVAGLLGLGIIVGVIALLVLFGGTAGLVIAVLLGIAAFGGALVIGFWLSTRLSLVPSALVIERLPLRAAIARSWSLTTGYFWKTLGIQLLVALIVQTVTGIITTPLGFAFGLVSALTNPNGDPSGLAVAGIVMYLLLILVSVVFGAIAAVVQSATTALIYIDIRMRKEGLDLELSRFVEARQAGSTEVADPYLVRAAPATGTPAAPASSPWS